MLIPLLIANQAWLLSTPARPGAIRARPVRLVASAESLSESTSVASASDSFVGRVVPLLPRKQEQPASRADGAVSLLKQYGPLYLAVSISLSICSFTLCYVGVAHAVVTGSLPSWCSAAASRTGKAGVAGVAYAVHKVRKTLVPGLRTRRPHPSKAHAPPRTLDRHCRRCAFRWCWRCFGPSRGGGTAWWERMAATGACERLNGCVQYRRALDVCSHAGMSVVCGVACGVWGCM